jgi:hypothetical protein
MAADPTGRPPSKFPCIYWSGAVCTATSKFAEREISCYNAGNCDGFGTCRGCSKYDQGGLKIDTVDGQGGHSQDPMNLQIYNLRAKMARCCHWDGATVDFKKTFVKGSLSADISYIIDNENNSDIEIRISGDLSNLEEFPQSGQLVAIREGTDEQGDPFPRVNIIYKNKGPEGFINVSLSPHYTEGESTTLVLNNDYTVYLSEHKATPIFKVIGPDSMDYTTGEMKTRCTLALAAPWQEGFTTENPSAYGCNGAKPECDFYTGPSFTEIVDAKMDHGDRISAKQLMELRWYSQDWASLSNDAAKKPRELWEELFEQADIWAGTKASLLEGEAPRTPGRVKKDDTTGKPFIEKVSITDFESSSPNIRVGPSVLPEDGTPVVGGTPSFPTLVRRVFDLTPSLKVLFPRLTSVSDPYVKRSFTEAERYIYVSVDAQSDNELVAINLTKHPQGSVSDEDFIKKVRRTNPEDVAAPFISGLPGETFSVELEYGQTRNVLNHIRVYMDTGLGEKDELDTDQAPGSFDPNNDVPTLPNGKRKYITVDIFVDHVFHHAHVAQTYFHDWYGHKQIDPWINNFTQMDLGGKIFDLTTNTTVDKVFWNTIASDGKKTMYSIENQKVVSSKDDTTDIRWESLGCSYILVEFLDPNINRVYPWKAWDEDSKEQPLYVKLDRSSNPLLTEGEPTEVEFELTLASTKGTVLPANVAIFKPKDNLGIRPPDVINDVLRVRYAYTEYKQGPLNSADVQKLKFPSDNDKIIELMPYGITFNTDSFAIDGTFVRAGTTKIYSCDQLLGDCYREKASENEKLSRSVFFAGGIDEGDVKTHAQMINQCASEFNASYAGSTFDDGTRVTYEGAVERLENMYLREGSQHYLFVFKDEEGRPVGVKHTGFLVQSSVAQTRDVEIRYKWGGAAQHYPNNDGMLMQAIFYAPLHSTTHRLVHLIREYDPYCGDHAGTEGGTQYRAFDLNIDKHGPLWYPYKRCQTPIYHSDSEIFVNVVEYSDTVEGFTSDKRRDYWERMRVWDKYMPVIMDFIPQLGCFWSERTTTLNVNPPYVFLGYTKTRSLHPFGSFNSDRESLRVSRHWEKRNLEFDAEVLAQDSDGGFSLSLDPSYSSALYDSNGNLKTGSSLETPVWVHINDDIGVVTVAGEALEHPFNHLLLQRVGTHEFNESYLYSSDNRYDLRDILEERDYTSTLDRSTDGTKIYLADGTQINTVASGIEAKVVNPGKDIRLVYKKENPAGKIGWAWMAEPDAPVRGDNPITGLFLSNPPTYFKTNLVPATYPVEGFHTVTYTAHEFDNEGAIATHASITLDGGPPLYINVNTGLAFINEESPYNPNQHEGEDYTFVLNGTGPSGFGILADKRGLQRYEKDGQKFATYAGLISNINFDVDELPYRISDIRTLNVADLTVKLGRMIGEYSSEVPGPDPTNPDYTRSLNTGMESLHGHYFVENLTIKFTYGGQFDIPTVTAKGVVYDIETQAAEQITLFSPTDYISGTSFALGSTYTLTVPINARLAGISLSIGARRPGRYMRLDSIDISVRRPENRSESIYVYNPKLNVSTAETGSHTPSDLEFYFQRAYPDFAKDYVSGSLIIGDLSQGQDITASAGVEVKYTGRRIKDVIPHFEFTDPINNRFPYNNIAVDEIDGYVEESSSLGTLKYIDSAVQTSSKGWTLYTGPHEDDPGDSLSHPNAIDGIRPFEELQESIYNDAGLLLGDKLAVFQSFWHPKEVEFFSRAGVQLNQINWTLTMASIVAPLDRVFRHENYGCSPSATNEYTDGLVHKMENWQARGVFHYQCDPRYNYACLTTLMNKCETYLFDEYGTPAYLDNDVFGRFNYVFAFPPREYSSYISAGLIDKNYTSGSLGGFTTSAAQAATASSIPTFSDPQKESVTVPTKGPGDYQ